MKQILGHILDLTPEDFKAFVGATLMFIISKPVAAALGAIYLYLAIREKQKKNQLAELEKRKLKLELDKMELEKLK